MGQTNSRAYLEIPLRFPDAGIDNFVKLGLEANPGMRFVVQISWGGWDIDNQDFPKGATKRVNWEKTPEELKKLYPDPPGLVRMAPDHAAVPSHAALAAPSGTTMSSAAVPGST